MLKIGSIAPNFVLSDKDHIFYSLAEYQGLPVFVFFYPKDETPGCIQEACAIRDMWDSFLDHSVVVFGINTDSEKSHESFAHKYKLPFPLLSDQSSKTAKAYEAYDEQNKKIKRISYLINPKGVIIRSYSNFKPKEHAFQVLQDIRTLKL